MGWDLLPLHHSIEELTAPATSLHPGVHVKVKNTKWLHLHKAICSVAHEKLLVADLDEANTLFALGFKVGSVVLRAQLRYTRDHLGKVLGLG